MVTHDSVASDRGAVRVVEAPHSSIGPKHRTNISSSVQPISTLLHMARRMRSLWRSARVMILAALHAASSSPS